MGTKTISSRSPNARKVSWLIGTAIVFSGLLHCAQPAATVSGLVTVDLGDGSPKPVQIVGNNFLNSWNLVTQIVDGTTQSYVLTLAFFNESVNFDSLDKQSQSEETRASGDFQLSGDYILIHITKIGDISQITRAGISPKPDTVTFTISTTIGGGISPVTTTFSAQALRTTTSPEVIFNSASLDTAKSLVSASGSLYAEFSTGSSDYIQGTFQF